MKGKASLLTRMAKKWHRAWTPEYLPRFNNLPAVNKHMKKMGYVGVLIGSMTSNGIDIHRDIDVLCVGKEKPDMDEGNLDWWLPDELGYTNQNNGILPFSLEADFASVAPGLYLFPNLTRLIYQHRIGQFFPFPNEHMLVHELDLGILDLPAKLKLLPNRRWQTLSAVKNGKEELLSNIVFAAYQDNEIAIAPSAFTASYNSALKFDFIFKTVPGLHRFLQQRLDLIPFISLKDRIYFSDENPVEPIRACDGSILQTCGSVIDFSHWVTLAERVKDGLTLDLQVKHPNFRIYFEKLKIDKTIRKQSTHEQAKPELCIEDVPDFEEAFGLDK